MTVYYSWALDIVFSNFDFYHLKQAIKAKRCTMEITWYAYLTLWHKFGLVVCALARLFIAKPLVFFRSSAFAFRYFLHNPKMLFSACVSFFSCCCFCCLGFRLSATHIAHRGKKRWHGKVNRDCFKAQFKKETITEKSFHFYVPLSVE